ncbi:MAG: hypothetical protein AAF933_04505 [Pseudomonadota bacterium]
MKRVIPGLLLLSSSLQAFAHEGHGADSGSVLHYFSGPHLFLMIFVGLCVAGACYVGLKDRRERR